jgi:hypothetical protein
MSSAPSTAARLAVALAVASGASCIAAYSQFASNGFGGDFAWVWRATKIVLDGGNPYTVLRPYSSEIWGDAYFYYPLPAIGFALPVVWLSRQWAAIAFVAGSTFLLALAITRDGFHRVPPFVSAPYFVMCALAQTSAATLAFALVPSAAGLTVMKPNLGLALFLSAPRWRTALVGALLLVGSVVVAPEWPRTWLAVLSTSPHHRSMLATVGGPLALLALLRWRRPGGRLVAAMEVIPHAPFLYDDVPLWLVPQTYREAFTLTWLSWVGFGAWFVTNYDPALGGADLRRLAPWIVVTLYLPAVVMILRRRNEGNVPAWVERAIARLPAWVRGHAASISSPLP